MGLTPEWAKLAKSAKTSGWSEKGVVIAKMDATENECQEEVSGYPKLILYPAVKSENKLKQKKEFSGTREYEPMVEFLVENAKNRIEAAEEKSGKKGGGYSM